MRRNAFGMRICAFFCNVYFSTPTPPANSLVFSTLGTHAVPKGFRKIDFLNPGGHFHLSVCEYFVFLLFLILKAFSGCTSL